MSLKGTKTEENLKEAFAGESQANRRYLYLHKRLILKVTMMWQQFLDQLQKVKQVMHMVI